MNDDEIIGQTVLVVVMVPAGGPDPVPPGSAKPRLSIDDLARAKRDCVPCHARPDAHGFRAAVVIPCRDYGRYLADAVESALAQTFTPSEVLVVDDSSTDDTPAVAASFAARGVKYLRVDAGSVWEARKAGFLATAADVLCFLDADDVLPPEYLAAGLALFDSPGVGVVYSDYREFGDAGGTSGFPEAFSLPELERGNYIHAGSLVRRRALEVSAAFEAPRPHNSWADWYLWKRVCGAGFTARKQASLYGYRRHAGGMLLANRGAGVPYYDLADLAAERVTVVCPLSGRGWAWPEYRAWLEGQTWPRAQCALLVIDTGPTAGVREWVGRCGYPDVRYRTLDAGPPGLADRPRLAARAAVNRAMRRIYSAAARCLDTPFAFILEDDVLPPPDAVARLLRGFDRDTDAVSGAYPSRFTPGAVAWQPGGGGRFLESGEGVTEVGGVGFGCLLVRRAALAGETFAGLPGAPDDYDTEFFARLRAAGRKVKVDWSVKALHREGPGGSPV